MVTGHGMIATHFQSYQANNSFLIFASGVSNSRNGEAAAFEREAALLQAMISAHPDKRLVYFSTCSIYDPAEKNSLYVLHKIELEKYIIAHAPKYLILRVSNLAGKSSNPHTVLNFFFHHIKNKIPFQAWMQATRNLIAISDLYRVTDHILQKGLFQNQVINVANPVSYTVPEIIEAFERQLQTHASYEPIQKGQPFNPDITSVLPLYQTLQLDFNEKYLDNLIKKYYINQ